MNSSQRPSNQGPSHGPAWQQQDQRPNPQVGRGQSGQQQQGGPPYQGYAPQGSGLGRGPAFPVQVNSNFRGYYHPHAPQGQYAPQGQSMPQQQYAPNQFVNAQSQAHVASRFGQAPMGFAPGYPVPTQTYAQTPVYGPVPTHAPMPAYAPNFAQPQQRFAPPVQLPTRPASQAPGPGPVVQAVVPQRVAPQRDDRMANVLHRWRTLASGGAAPGALNADMLKQLGSNNVLRALREAVAERDGGSTLTGACTLANAYLDVVNHQRSVRSEAGNRAAIAIDATLGTLAAELPGMLRTTITALSSPGSVPSGRDTALRLLRLVADAPNILPQWLHAAGKSSLIKACFVDGGQRMRADFGDGSLLFSFDRNGKAAAEDVDVGRLLALLHPDVADADAHAIARWLCTHAEHAYTTNHERAHEALRLAFNLCPSFDPDTLRANATRGPTFEQFLSEAWSLCRDNLLDIASQQTSGPNHGWADDVETRAVFWSLALQLCGRTEPAWQAVLASFIERVPMYADALSETDRPRFAELLCKLPVRVATEMQVAALTTWFADNLSQPASVGPLLEAARQFLRNVATDPMQVRRAPLYGMLGVYAKKSENYAITHALLDLFPAHERFMGMETTLAANLLMNVDEAYLTAHADMFEAILQVIHKGDAPYADLCHKDTAARWRAVLSIESLQPVSVEIVQREYAEMRPAISIAHILQTAVARGTDIEVTRKLEQIATELPGDASLYIRLNMALAERGRGTGGDSTSAKKAPKSRSLAKTPARAKLSPKTLEKSLVRLETVLARSTREQDAQPSTLEPLPIDFLRQEMAALKAVDMSSAKDTVGKVSAQALRQFGGMLSAHIDQTFRELLTLTEVMVRREEFSNARPLMQLLLQHVTQNETQIDGQEKAAIEATLRTWTAQAPSALQDMARTFGAMDFAQSLRTLHTASTDKKQTSDERQKAQQERIRALDQVTQALADTSPDDNRVRHAQLATFLPQILTVMGSRSEREALGAFWPAGLSNLAPTAFDAKALSLAYASIASSTDATRPQIRRLSDKVAGVLAHGLKEATSKQPTAGMRDALLQVVEEGGWTRAFKILLLNPKVLTANLPASVVLQMLKAAPVKVLRDNNGAISLLTKRLLESSEPITEPQVESTAGVQAQSPWNDRDRLALLQEHLDALSFLRLLDRAGVGSDNPAARATLSDVVASNQLDVLHTLTDAKSAHLLSRQSTLYWGVRDALAAATKEPALLLQQLAEALDVAPEERVEARSMAFLRSVLRQPEVAKVTALDTPARSILSKNLDNWYGALGTINVAARVQETAVMATLWRLRGDFSNVQNLVGDLLAQDQHDVLGALFETSDAALIDAAIALFKRHAKPFADNGKAADASQRAGQTRAAGAASVDARSDAAHVALHAAALVLRGGDKAAADSVLGTRASFVNAFALTLAESALLDHVTPNDRAVLAQCIALLRAADLGTQSSVALIRRLARAWVDTARSSEAGKQLTSQMQSFLEGTLNSDGPSVVERGRAAVRSAVRDCLVEDQGTKAWRLLSLLRDADGIDAETLQGLLLKSHLCAPQEVRTNVPKILAALSPAVAIPGLVEEGLSDKGAWMTLSKVPAAAPWLLEHLQHIFATTGRLPKAFAANWQSVVMRMPAAEREQTLSKATTDLPASSCTYAFASPRSSPWKTKPCSTMF